MKLYFGKKRIFEDEMLKDIHMLIGNWFCALEDEGCDPWKDPECIAMAWKYGYTKKKYNKFLSTIY